MTYKIGDKVKIRSWESMENEFGADKDGDLPTNSYFLQGMRQSCGLETTITGNGFLEDDYILEDGGRFFYSTDVFVGGEP